MHLRYGCRGGDFNSPDSLRPNFFRGLFPRAVCLLEDEVVWPIPYGRLAYSCLAWSQGGGIGMLQAGSWSRAFSYKEKVYRDTTLEILATFKVDRGLVGFNRAGSIKFQLFGEQRKMIYTEFSLYSWRFMILNSPAPDSMRSY